MENSRLLGPIGSEAAAVLASFLAVAGLGTEHQNAAGADSSLEDTVLVEVAVAAGPAVDLAVEDIPAVLAVAGSRGVVVGSRAVAVVAAADYELVLLGHPAVALLVRFHKYLTANSPGQDLHLTQTQSLVCSLLVPTSL